jgi:hypothetical protein
MDAGMGQSNIKTHFKIKRSSIRRFFVVGCLQIAVVVLGWFIASPGIGDYAWMSFLSLFGFLMLGCAVWGLRKPVVEVGPDQLIVRLFLVKSNKLDYADIKNLDVQSADWSYLNIRTKNGGQARVAFPVAAVEHGQQLIEALEQKLGGPNVPKSVTVNTSEAKGTRKGSSQEPGSRHFYEKTAQLIFCSYIISVILMIGGLFMFSVWLEQWLSNPPKTNRLLNSTVFAIPALVFFTGAGVLIYLRTRKRLSIVTLTPKHVRIQTAVYAPVYQIPYAQIRKISVKSPNDAFLHVDTEGRQQAIRLPVAVFSQKQRTKMLEMLRRKAETHPEASYGAT